MLSADWRCALAVLGAVGLAGCSSVSLAPAQTVVAPAAPAASAQAPAKPAGPGPKVLAEATTSPVPAAAQSAYDEALRALRAGRTEEAERGLRAMTQKYPGLGGPHANLALVHRRAGRLNEAVAEFENAVKASPRQPVFFNQLGISYRQQGQFSKAREAYEAALALDSNHAAATLNLAILFDLYIGDTSRALALYQRCLELTPNDAPTLNRWLAELKSRKPAVTLLVRKEKE
jgi:tetratricopeptide (TPR) repeat protein